MEITLLGKLGLCALISVIETDTIVMKFLLNEYYCHLRWHHILIERFLLPPSWVRQTTWWCHVPEDCTPYIHCHENINSHKFFFIHMRDKNFTKVNTVLQIKQSTCHKIDRIGSCMKFKFDSVVIYFQLPSHCWRVNWRHIWAPPNYDEDHWNKPIQTTMSPLSHNKHRDWCWS